MSDRVSKSLTVNIKGNTYIASPLGLMALDLCEQMAFEQYQEIKLNTLEKNKASIISARGEEYFNNEYDRVLNMTPEDLPKKSTFVPVRTRDGRGFEMKAERIDGVLTGRKVPVLREISVEYPGWWMAETIKGKLVAIWLSLRQEHPEITLELVDTLFQTESQEYDETRLNELAAKVGLITAPSVGKSKKP